MIGTIVNLFRHIIGKRYFDYWNEKDMFYVLTNSGDFADWLQIRRQMRYRKDKQGELK